MIRVFPRSIRSTTDSRYGDTASRHSSTSSIDSAYNFLLPLLPIALKRKIVQKNAPVIGKSGPIRTCVDFKFTSSASKSNLTSSIYSTNQLFIWFPPSPQNRQKSPKTTTNKSGGQNFEALCFSIFFMKDHS